MTSDTNPTGLRGIEFVEYCSKEHENLDQLFKAFGFSKLSTNAEKDLIFYKQNDINFIVNNKLSGHTHNFVNDHGPSISSMAFRVENADKAFEVSVKNGARAAEGEYTYKGKKVPAIYGIGDSLLYFVDKFEDKNFYQELGFIDDSVKEEIEGKGFIRIDHLTNNVYKGTMQKWTDFYKQTFGFTEVRYFDIKGAKTGLKSFALQSPCKTFCIPINEGTEAKSQINEYLEEYNGPGIQHIAFTSEDIVKSVESLAATQIETLDIDDEYYDEVFDRVPNVTEDQVKLRKNNILVDGDDEGYLLQIFTKNVIGPIFIEIIQRKNHDSFGEGNFGALFRSIEKDQEKRGYLD
ncbi:4-hydroxyphenylpyruvate dioxygenase [Halobacteriovorax marinus]|uniref:4-hydroxyphenylpyruvate dioxygenase n=1 Tax=Halobacteriovorax marinus TaxID=97084 RepID=A0A1Y5F3D1_9BACT|nr:4-hydroxyphenylpyruvate dioxygenase [Halobacteriovorax marinus]